MRYERVEIKRDGNTVHNKEVAPWEIPILEFLFDEGNVRRLGVYVEAPGEYPDAAKEHARLHRVYGEDAKSGEPFVVSIYGNAGAGVRALRKEIEAAQADEKEAERQVKKPSPTRKSRTTRDVEADALLS